MILAILLTLTDIIGFLHFWGITIDIISCINIVLAIGLCVDYSVHICHAFLVAKVHLVDQVLDNNANHLVDHIESVFLTTLLFCANFMECTI